MSKSLNRKLAVLNLILDGKSGGVRLVEENLSRLAAFGWDPHVFAQRVDRARFDLTKPNIHKISRPKFTRLGRIKWFDWRARRLTRRGYDLVVAHGFASTADVLHVHNCLALEARRCDRASVMQSAEARFQKKSYTAARFGGYIANSRLTANFLSSEYNIHGSDIHVVYPGVDLQRFRPRTAPDRRAIRQEFGLPQDKILIMLATSGNFHKRGVDKLIDAMRALAPDTARQTGLVIVGNDRRVEHYRRMAAGLSMPAVFLPSQARIYDLLAAVDVFALPARLEEFGMVALEAMACGNPVLLNKWVGAAELILPPWREYVAPDHQDTHGLAAQISELISDAGKREAFGAAMRAQARAYSWEANVAGYCAVYNQLALTQ